jgi:hypothetical protein
MNGSTLRRTALLIGGLCATPLALAQNINAPAALGQDVTTPPHWGFIATMGGMGMLMVLGIIAISVINENRKNRDKLAMLERLVTGGQPVPRELITGEVPPLPLAQERRRDIRRGITLLCWAIAVTAIPVIGSGGEWRYGAWGLLFLLPSLGSFFKAWLTAREIARGGSSGSSQP